MSNKFCPSCGASLDLNAGECKYCGETITTSLPQQPQAPQYQAPPQQAPAVSQPMYTTTPYKPAKSKVVAGLLGIFVGGLGIHKFYLGKIGMGILYLLFCWTYVPAIIGFIEGIIYLTKSDAEFNARYVK
ncbi:MAG: NINE protein [Tissierellales bacterium]